jgi:hypothetical protein
MKIPAEIKKEISRLRSEVRNFNEKLTKSEQTNRSQVIRPSVVSGNYWTQTGIEI